MGFKKTTQHSLCKYKIKVITNHSQQETDCISSGISSTKLSLVQSYEIKYFTIPSL